MDSARQAKGFYSAIGVQGLAERTDPKKTELVIRDLRTLFSKGQLLLDVGCGYGRITVPLAVLGYAVRGVDITPGFIRAARRYARDECVVVPFKVGDMRHLPYPDASFHGLFCLWSAFNELLTKRDQHLAIKSMRDVLKPGGLAVIDLPDMRHPHPIFEIRRSTRIVRDTTTGHKSYLHDAATLETLMRRAGIANYKISIRNFWGRKRLVLLFWKG